MIETAENVARDKDIAREDADAFAVESHARAARAQKLGVFEAEIAPVAVPQKKGDPVLVAADEGVRADATLAALAALKPLMKGGQVTAGNSSQQNDAAAAMLLVEESKLAAWNLRPMGFVKGWAAAGCHPATMGLGPVPAVAKLFARLGLSWKDIGLVELNEAFAAQVLGVLRGWDWDDRARLNVNGGGISLGHPIGATGARIAVSLLHEMSRRKAALGLETMCVGGGQGMAAIFEAA
jgi:acetyl-CoA C-acetyltransferase